MSKGLLCFTLLFFKLAIQHCRKKGSIGLLPIIVCFLIIINGIFAMVRTAALFPNFNVTDNYNFVAVAYFLEEISFYLALWLFGTKYFEVALDMERLLGRKNDQSSSSTASNFSEEKEKAARVKQKFHYARIAVSILIVIAHIPLLVSQLKTNLMGETYIALSGISMILLCTVVLTIATFMSVALWKFTRIVSSMPFRSDLNRFLIFIEILSILGWAAGSFGIGIEYCINYD